MRIIFVDYANNYAFKDPIITCVKPHYEQELNDLLDILKLCEERQPAAGRTGGNWKEIMKDSGIAYDIDQKTLLSKYRPKTGDLIYELEVGNY